MELGAIAIFAIISGVIQWIASSAQQSKEYNQQQSLLRQEQEFTREREDLAYERSRPDTQMQNFLDAGFNPNLAAEAVLGGNGQEVSSTGSPSAPTTNSAIDALQSALGGSYNSVMDNFLKQAQARNLDANTNRTEVEAGLLPRDFELRSRSTEAQISMWNKSVEKMTSEIDYNKEQTDLVRQQNMYYGRMSESQIHVYESQAKQACSNAFLSLKQAKTEDYKQANLASDTSLKHAETDKVFAETAETYQNIENLETENYGKMLDNARNKIALDFEKSIGDIPLTADGKQYVMKLANDGKYEQIEQFYGVIFSSALNQELGKQFGTPAKSKISLPFGLLSAEKNDFQKLYNMYNSPYWNPQ